MAANVDARPLDARSPDAPPPDAPWLQSCADVLASGGAAGDGEYEVDPDGPGGEPPRMEHCNMTLFDGGWTRCLQFQNTSDEDLDTNDWLDRCVDDTMADWSGNEILITLEGLGGNLAYAAKGTRSNDWTYDNLTSTARSADQYDFEKHNKVVPLSLDGATSTDKLVLPGRSSDNLGCVGSLGNGYAVLVYDANATSLRFPKIMALPYRFQNGENQGEPRQFGDLNDQWITGNEISYDGTTTWSTCIELPAFPGTLSLYVR